MAWCSCPVNSLLLTSITCLSSNSPCRLDQRHLPGTKFSTVTFASTNLKPKQLLPRHSQACMFGWYRLCVLASFPWTSSFLRLTQNDAVPPQTSCTHIYKWVREFRSDFRSELALLAVTMLKLVTSPLRELQPLNMAALNKKMEKER